jgi:ribosome-associated protein
LGNTAETGVSVYSATDTPTWQIALRAAASKQALDIKVLDLREVTTFADFFLICSGRNKPQVQAIWDEIALQMKNEAGDRPHSVEGFENAEWILGDYGDLLVHIFDPEKRDYYGLERLWRHALSVDTGQQTPTL